MSSLTRWHCRRCHVFHFDKVSWAFAGSSEKRFSTTLLSRISPESLKLLHNNVRGRIHGSRHFTSSAALQTRPFRLAIVGSGPAGFYAASRVLKLHNETKIDMYEQLPVPFGLVRYGVAPDHPEVKNCEERFEEIAESPNFRFIGNVTVGSQIPLDLMKRHYDAILFAYGADQDRQLDIKGENLRGVWSARDFVAWYNGLPNHVNTPFDLQSASDVVVIGQGNVALDVSRILLTSLDSLRRTDIPEHVLETLSTSGVRRVSVIGRRGPLQVGLYTSTCSHVG